MKQFKQSLVVNEEQPVDDIINDGGLIPSTLQEDELPVTFCNVLSIPLYRRFMLYYLVLFVATYESASFVAGYAAAYLGGCKTIKENNNCHKDYDYDKYNLLLQLSNSVSALFAFICAPLVGYLSDKFGRKPFFMIQIMLYVLPYLVAIFYNNMYLYIILITLRGFNGSVIITTPITRAYISDILPQKLEIMGYALIYLLAGFGLLFGEIVGFTVSRIFNDHSNFYVITFLFIVAFIYLLIFIPESLHKKHPTKRNKNPSEPVIEHHQSKFKYFCSNKIVLWIALTYGMITLPSMGLVDIATVVLADIFDANSNSGFNKVALYYILGWSFGLIIGPIIILPILRKYFNEFQVLIVSLFFLMIGSVMFLIVSLCKYELLIPLPAIIIGIGFLCFAPLNTILTKHTDPNDIGTAFGIVASVQALCNIIAPISFALTYHYLKSMHIQDLIFGITVIMLLLSLLFTIPLKRAIDKTKEFAIKL